MTEKGTGMASEVLIQRVEERVDRFEAEVRDEIKNIKDTLLAQAVTQSRNETILANLVDEVKSFRTEFMGLLTESIKAQQSQNTAWNGIAVKVILALLGIVGTVYGVSNLAAK